MIKTWQERLSSEMPLSTAMQDEIDELRTELAALEAQEPVAWINTYGESPMLSMCAPDDDRGTVAAHWRPLYLAAGAEPVKSETTEDEALRISELPDIDEAIRSLIEDGTEDNAVCLVRMVLAAAQQ